MLSQDIMHHVAMDIGQSEISSTEMKGQLLVVETEQVQHRGMQVVYGHGIFLHAIAIFVGPSVDHTSADAAAGHPHAEGGRILVATIGAFCARCAHEFSGA